ncbi:MULTISPECIES: hypothetical protein [Streptomyces]|uniref:hypothetical protein n=1 Tax=Streptomyces TaxID=1883 RepID=UPI00292F5766|nr:hypothetical protein [Streptomyces sp. NEAU-HV9]
MTDDDLSNLGLEFSEDWVPFPAIGTANRELDHWCSSQAGELAERYARDGEQADVRALTRDLRRAAADSHARTPLAAFGWYVSGHNTVAAIMDLDAIHPDDTVPDVSLAWLTGHMTVRDLGAPDVREVRLPLGDAVRIRQNFVGEKKRLLGPRPVIRSLFYGVRPDGMDTAITLALSWTEPVLDEPVEQMGDTIAGTLSL